MHLRRSEDTSSICKRQSLVGAQFEMYYAEAEAFRLARAEAAVVGSPTWRKIAKARWKKRLTKPDVPDLIELPGGPIDTGAHYALLVELHTVVVMSMLPRPPWSSRRSRRTTGSTSPGADSRPCRSSPFLTHASSRHPAGCRPKVSHTRTRVGSREESVPPGTWTEFGGRPIVRLALL